MKKVTFEQNGIMEFFKSKGFYVALAVCLLAVGAATWVALDSLKPSIGSADATGSTYSSPNTAAADASAAAKPNDTSSSAAASRSSTTASHTGTASAEPQPSSDGTTVKANTTATYFVLPLTGDIIKNFSATELQYSDTYKDWRLHTAVDIQGDLGAKVKACGEGRVVGVTADPM